MRSSPIIAFWAVSLLLGLSVAAVAAPKKKLAPPPPIYNWTGFYIGGTAGGAWTTDNVNLTTAGGTLYVPSYYPGLDALGSPGLSGSSAMFGGKIGYNWQWNPLVLGIEGDISSFHFNKGSSSAGNPYLVPPSAGFTSGTAMFNTNESTTWLSTVRARVGYAVDRILFYGTGGAALTNLSFSNSYTSHSPLGGFPNDVEATSASQTRIGWAAGAGIDYNVLSNWIVSIEYLYVAFNFGAVSAPIIASNGATAAFSFRTNCKAISFVRVSAISSEQRQALPHSG